MNPQDPLAALHPLREPAPIHWWPPAPGWWLLLALLLLVLLVLLWWLWRRYQRAAYRRQGLRQLAALHQRLQADQDSGRFAAAVNALLKSVALRAYPRREIAATSGEPWLAFLAATAGEGPALPAELAAGPYRASVAIDADALYRAAAHWIQHHRPLPQQALVK